MASKPPEIADALEAKRGVPEDVFDHFGDGADLITGLANGEPVTVVDTLEAGAGRLSEVTIHQMFPVRTRRYMHGAFDGLKHASWFLSPSNREAFHEGACDLIPNNFSDVPHLMSQSTQRSLALAATSPPDRHGYFSLGTQAEYLAAMVGEIPFFLEANHKMPRTLGENQVHISQVAGWCEAEYPLFELPTRPMRETDRKIAEYVAERIPDGATLQAGIGAIPDEVLRLLGDHSNLGVHTELLSDGIVDLVERGVVTGASKSTHRNKIISTTSLGSKGLYDSVDENPGVEFWPVSYTNDPRNIAKENHMAAINATLEVDFLGQCASESLGSEYWSSSGGQPDFARGAMFAKNGQSFIVLHSTTADESVSRIVAQLHPGAAVTTFQNVVDCVVTEYGVAELRGSSICERTSKLIGIAHPKFRDGLTQHATEMGYM